MPQAHYYDPAERQREKERHRASDAERLVRGDMSQHDLRRQNVLFGSLEIVDSSIRCQKVFD